MTLPCCSNRVAMCFFVLMVAYTALAVAKDSVMWGGKFIVKESDIALESLSGCQVLWTDILLNCSEMLVPSEYSQLVSFRVDCRGAQGDSENLTLLDKTPRCAALHYRRYENSSEFIDPDPPVFKDGTFTFQTGDVFEMDCVLLPFESMRNKSLITKVGNTTYKNWPVDFYLRKDGKDSKFTAFNFRIPFDGKDSEDCDAALESAYSWYTNTYSWYTNQVLEPSNNSHMIELKSPKFRRLRIQSIFPRIGYLGQQDDIPVVDKDYFHPVVLKASSRIVDADYVKLVKVEVMQFLHISTYLQHAVILFLQLDVDAAELPNNVKELMITLGLEFRKDEPYTEFTLELPVETSVRPVRPGDSSKSGFSWYFWPLLFLILLAVIAAIGYVYRERLFRLPANAGTVAASDSRNIEMQRPS